MKFTPDKVGELPFHCDVFCSSGQGHGLERISQIAPRRLAERGAPPASLLIVGIRRVLLLLAPRVRGSSLGQGSIRIYEMRS